MAKRSSFKRNARDLYRTFDPRAVAPLLPFLRRGQTFIEPCAGYGDLTAQLAGVGLVCQRSFDIKPLADGIGKLDALQLTEDHCAGASHIITNPPWDRKLLHPMIMRFSMLRPTWLLFDADWAHTQQSERFMPYCRTIVSVGRVRWMPGTKQDGKDNAAWYLFGDYQLTPPAFYGRTPRHSKLTTKRGKTLIEG